MSPFLRSLALLVLCAPWVSGCAFEISGPEPAEQATVKVSVTGGVAGVDYAYQVDTGGDVTGLRCTSGCSFQEGEVLLRLTPGQRGAILDAVNASGLPTAGRPADFGTACCDAFDYLVIYSSGLQVRSFRGSPSEFPEPLQDLVRTLQLLYEGTPPVVLSQFDGLDGFGRDEVQIVDVRVVDDILELDVSFAGECAPHDLDAVVWTDWRLADPAEVGVALAHDAGGDTCEALVERTLRYDLDPLGDLYRGVFGSDAQQIVLLLEPAAGAPSGEPQRVSYTF
ncbi:MAG: hypothetical protein PVJ02_05505 [Gemmatimonadota bacterium]|jgi:hypothetical protein